MWFFFFFNDTATTEIYTLSLHDALPISPPPHSSPQYCRKLGRTEKSVSTGTRAITGVAGGVLGDRKSTRLNSSHLVISYAVFCLKKKKTTFSRSHTRPASQANYRRDRLL